MEGECNIKLRDGAKPTIQPQRNVPLRLLNKLKSTICDLEKSGVIVRVNQPVEWGSNLVIV